MTTIKANCPICGQVDLTPGDIRLRVSLVDQDECAYTFLCPQCRVLTTKPADARVAHLLMSAGIRPTFVTGDPMDGTIVPPLSEADLTAFVAALASDDYLADSA